MRACTAGELTAVWVQDDPRPSAGSGRGQQRAETGAPATSVFPVAPWPDLYRPQAMDACRYKWLTCQAFDHPAHHILLAEYCQAIEDRGILVNGVVVAYQAMRGVAFRQRSPLSSKWAMSGALIIPVS